MSSNELNWSLNRNYINESDLIKKETKVQSGLWGLEKVVAPLNKMPVTNYENKPAYL